MNEDFISCEKYKKMCELKGITEKSAQNTLADYLDSLGVISYFNEFYLDNTRILNPKWATQGVYKIINSKQLKESKGVLKLNTLNEILKKEKDTDYNYPKEQYSYIINLMKKFELCYNIDEETILIPNLLDKQEPLDSDIDFDFKNSLNFIIDYDFLTNSVMPRFSVKMHKDIKMQWRTGIVLGDKNYNCSALIKADKNAKKIYIYVNGEQKQDYFSVILYLFREINTSFEKVKIKELVPMMDNSEITVSYEHLIRLNKNGIEKYMPDGSDNEYNVNDLLGNIYQKKNEEQQIQTSEQILTKLEKLEGETGDAKINFWGDVIRGKPMPFGPAEIDFNAFYKYIKQIYLEYKTTKKPLSAVKHKL